MKKRSTQRTEADEQLLEEADEYFDTEEIIAMQENAISKSKARNSGAAVEGDF